MWSAIRNAAGRVRKGGLFYLAIYNKVEGRGSSEYWLRVKRLYNRSPRAAKRLMDVLYVIRYQFLPKLIRLQNPIEFEKTYKERRGMTLWIDVRDWLGGYPYEFARADEIILFCMRQLGLSLVNLRTVNSLGLNEFLFQK
jgi:2-polyprenyl-6-hydroxyphenyl methylase/3-demethylubiquinone-9 3-methyltransferase